MNAKKPGEQNSPGLKAHFREGRLSYLANNRHGCVGQQLGDVGHHLHGLLLLLQPVLQVHVGQLCIVAHAVELLLVFFERVLVLCFGGDVLAESNVRRAVGRG